MTNNVDKGRYMSNWIEIDFHKIKEETEMGPRSQAKACGISWNSYKKYVAANAAPDEVAKIIAERLNTVYLQPSCRAGGNIVQNVNRKGGIKRKPMIKPALKTMQPNEIKELREKVLNT